MSKILTVADIHIHDYPNRNPSNNYRLYQGSKTVAENIIEAAKQYGCEYIVLAGDIVEKSIVRPYVQAEVKNFLDTIMANFKEGYIIYGNHDADNKSSDQTIADAFLGVMLPPNLHYMHQKTIAIDGTLIGFSNWQPDFDLSWIQNKVDVLFTHARICYATDSDGMGLFESQELNEDKFDLAICGDIHRMAQTGKYVSIGPSQKCKMGDSDSASAVVFDCTTKKWEWINLDPKNKLMKFEYTPDLDLEGWVEEKNTWLVYKQDNSELLGVNQNIKLSAWEEIGTLINDAIVKSGLQNVHAEILKNIKNADQGEVDFNFTLLKFHCENWRSIDEVTMDFKDGDKILIQGSNGSGKSSILSAIKYAFVDVADTIGLTSLKPFVQFGTKDCLTEVEFLYQGNICKIQRGTKSYGLWINGEPQKYSEKRLFEKDVRDRFPFIKYMDAFFFDSTHNEFIGSLSPERLTEITSKFLKLDRIDTYNETARILSEQLRKDVQGWQAKAKETEKLLTYIDEKLAVIQVPNSKKEDLEKQKQEGLELQRKNNEWNKYASYTALLQAQITQLLNNLDENNKKFATLREPTQVNSEITNLQEQIKNHQSKLVELGNIRVNLNFKQQELERLKTEGNNAWIEAQSIGVGKVCSHCGQVIKTSETMEAHKTELLNKVEELKPKINELKQEIQNLEYLKNNSDQEYQNINLEITKLNSEITKRMSEIQEYNLVSSNIQKDNNSLLTTQNTLNSLGVVEKVELPDNFMNMMSEIESGILAWNMYESNINDKIQKQNEFNQYISEYNRLNSCLSELDAYIKLTGLTGIIYEEIMNKLKVQFSDNLVNYTVERRGKGNKEHLSLIPQYINNGNYTDYSAASSGQKTLLDLHYLSKIVSRLGLLILDEHLKHLDSSNADIAVEMLKDMNIGCLLLTSHMDSLSAFNNKTCKLSLNNSGSSIIDFK